ncbi:hypothetical protein [Halobellus limi]|uniref:Uncharacterized protein n=1 Tax=Halobellus limi TaxID=699433 RepID=A0A1H5ZI83_9EURY|nr:hypothetical protein [Halobellus limi]QCC48103.1 hypothetical protein DV707_10765 [Halobellus limi]SEG35465.1 hypothetical protein SAMN04488133_1991 [Halobellus limi]
MATTLYNNFKTLLLNGGVDLDTDTIRALIIDDSAAYTPDIDTHIYVDDVTAVANEMSGTGYTRKTLNVSVSTDNTNDQGVVDADDLSYTGLDAGTIQGVLIYKEVTTDSDSPVVGWYESADFPLPTNGGDVTLTINASGLLTLG